MRSSFPALLYRFQMRLLLYLLLVGSIPLLVAVGVFYHQTNGYSQRELTANVAQAHQQVLTGAARELQAVRSFAQQAAEDYAVLAYSRQQAAGGYPAQIGELRSYIERFLYQQTLHNRYFAQICLTVSSSNRTLCSQGYGGLEAMGSPQDMRPGKFEPSVGGSDQGSYIVRYLQPVGDSASSDELGYIVIWYNLSRMMKDLEVASVDQALVDEEGRMLYRSGNLDLSLFPASVNGLELDGASVRSVRKLDVPGGEWSSYYQAPNTFAQTAMPSLRKLLALLFAVLAVLSIGSSLVFARYVTRPLHRLKGLMKRAELGDLKAYWMSKGMDEWNDLGESYNQMLNRLEELIKQVKLEEALKKEAEMEALHYQLNPHFLYNTLNTIKWVAKIHKTPQISEVVSALVRLLQASLGKKGDFITLREECGLVRDYMEIQSFRYGDRVQARFELDPQTERCIVPRMLLQPLVENAIIHGIEPSRRQGVITIRTWLDRDLLFCQVEDNGIGMEAAAGGRADGFAGAALSAERHEADADLTGEAGPAGGEGQAPETEWAEPEAAAKRGERLPERGAGRAAAVRPGGGRAGQPGGAGPSEAWAAGGGERPSGQELAEAQARPDDERAGATPIGGKSLRERMSGIGIAHIREKIKLYYGPEYKLHMTSKPGEGTVVRMFLPIHRSEE
ncbi:sensor histidine kinase [Paenibacillus athensensis]|uniref:histidine kinase n=1 Tax=Paenibacillus athensensis TaxID=1967502 RepID=A0A4Y8PVC1_9BACL|nr:sensor histidine kinase [Paenibacillus athensensis]MCD1261717.1 sensor histidine kinase [Paenibacillus athensensis]